MLYIKLENELCYVNLETKETGVITSGLDEYTYATNEQGNVISYVTNGADTIKLINLSNGEERQIDAGDKNKIRVCGYTGNNLVYGITPTKKVPEGKDFKFDISELIIVDSDLNEITSYKKKGIMITGIEITDTVIHLTRTKDGQKTDDDQLLDNTVKDAPAVKQSYYDDTKKYREVALSFATQMNANMETTVNNNAIKNITASVATLDANREKITMYYVYACGELKGMFEKDEKVEAERLAKEKNGLVINSNGEKIWTFEENYND